MLMICEDDQEIIKELEIQPDRTNSDIMESIKLLLEDIRSYTDGNDGEYALGVESGMQMAADMLETLAQKFMNEVDSV